jgi:acetyl-CoA carboxylase carboxyltransferase component
VSDPSTKGWEHWLRELEERLARARAMGGAARLERLHGEGRLDARERVSRLCDPGSFREIGVLVGGAPPGGGEGVPADGLVAGVGRVAGRPLALFAEDASTQGGSIGHGGHAKRLRLARLAHQECMPLVMLLDGAGERVTNALERYAHAPSDLQELAAMSGVVPILALVLGASAGHGALCAMLADVVVASESAALFSAGPPLVAAALGEQVDKQELGGASMHARESGVVHELVKTEDEAFAFARRLLSYLPSSAWERPPKDPDAPGERRLDAILERIPEASQRPYDVRAVLELVFDEGSLLELQPLHGRALVTTLARLGGRPVLAVANQPAFRAGAIDAEAAEKAAHFLELADAFHLPVVFLADNPGVLAGTRAERAGPVVFLADNPGVLAGTRAERAGTLRAAARMYAAQAGMRVPKLHVTLRKAFGFGSSLMGMNPFDGQSVTLALPPVSLGGVPAGSGSVAAGSGNEERERLEAAQGGAWTAADNLAYDEVVDPRELRNRLLAVLRAGEGRERIPAEPVRRTGVRP